MPRALALGNGNVLACFDEKGQLRDFYYHYVGLENHVGHGCVHRIGVLIDDQFSWLDDDSWQVSVKYAAETMASEINAVNQRAGIELFFQDIIYNEKNILVRLVDVINRTSNVRNIKVFFHQQFRIYDTSRRDTGYFDPADNTIVHYEGRRVFVMGGRCGLKPFEEYCIGNYGIEGKEGTWKDAEDGKLCMNPIEHGPVDSVLAFSLGLGTSGTGRIEYWMAIGRTIKETKELYHSVLDKTPEHIVETTKNFWRAWVNKKNFELGKEELRLVDFYKNSLLVIRTHIDNNGAIIASGDSDMLQYGRDTYAYVWPRDAAFVAMALDRAGYPSLTEKFYEFCKDAISVDGYFFHKYRSDRAVGSSWHPWVHNGKPELAIQEDETALVLVALWNYYNYSSDLEFIESIYNSIIAKAADFMCGYRDVSTGLPKPSYDLWEQKFGISTFTSSAVAAGLEAAANFSRLLGKNKQAKRYRSVAEEIKAAIMSYLYNKENSFFYNVIIEKDGQLLKDDTIDMSSFYGIFRFGILALDDPRMIAAEKVLKEKLFCDTPIGGIMRYAGDEYHRISPEAVPNPWIITTLWYAQYLIAKVKKSSDLQEAYKLIEWAMDRANEAGVLPEQVRSDNGLPMSTAPLTWSHAEVVATALDYLEAKKRMKQQAGAKGV